MLIHKMILTDESMRPIAVQIPYNEWLEIELVIKNQTPKKSHISHLSGTIKLSEDPVEYQQENSQRMAVIQLLDTNHSFVNNPHIKCQTL